MTGKWNVTSNIIGGTKYFAVYRLRDVNAVDHSGNREYATEWLESRTEVECGYIIEPRKRTSFEKSIAKIMLPSHRKKIIWQRNSPAHAYCSMCRRELHRTLFQLTTNKYIAYLDPSQNCACGGTWQLLIRR